jgi:DNA-directed RNA polymerase subunit RPC12/RpoP
VPPRWRCITCGRRYDAAGYLGPPEEPDDESPGMCPPCADKAFAAERDRLAAEGRQALAREWEAERRRLRAASRHWFP